MPIHFSTKAELKLMAKYKVDKKELSHLLETYVANQEVRTLSAVVDVHPLQYAEQTESLLQRGEQLGQTDLRLIASNLGTLGAAVLNTYDLQPTELKELYGGLVAVVAAGHTREWGELLQQVHKQVVEDNGSLTSYQFMPEFYRAICKPSLSQMTSDAVKHAMGYLNSKSSVRNTNKASLLLSHEECFGPKIDHITEDDITSVLTTHPDDDEAAQHLCTRYRLAGLGKVTERSRAISFQVSPLPGRVQPMDVLFRNGGVPSRMPAVAAKAMDYLAGKRKA